MVTVFDPERIRLSIVINNYNYAPFLKPCIDSILHQMTPNTEIIVVDDGSTDNSLDVLRSYGARIRIVTQPNSGQAAAMNRGVAAASGDVLMLLDADDVFHAGKIAAVGRVFARFRADAPVCVAHRYSWIDRDGRRRRRPYLARELLAALWYGGGAHKVMTARRAAELIARYGNMAWPCRTRTSMLCLNRAMADRVFPIPAEAGGICADDFVVRGCILSGDFYCLERALTAYRDHGANGWLHAKGQRNGRDHNVRLSAYLTGKYRAAGGVGNFNDKDSVIHYLYAQEGVPVLERCRRAWRRSPSDVRSIAYLALLVAKRTPFWVSAGVSRRVRGG